jgi:RNA-directed DNA polymerase
MRDPIGWIVDAEVRGDFDRIARMRLREGRRQRVNAGSLRRLLGKWRRAGVREEGRGSHPETGVVQGGVIAPVLAHICLQQVLDEWCAQAGQPRLRGRGVLRRFADDCVLGCAWQADAHRMMAVLPTRLARDGLLMHPTKTTLMACSKPEAPQGSTEGNGPCDVLGLPHDGTRSRRGDWGIKRRTAHKRLRRPTKSRWPGGRSHRHPPLQDQYQQ